MLHVSLSTEFCNEENYSAHGWLDAVVFSNSQSDVKEKMSHKTQWL